MGLMGREFASAAARWCHLTGMDVRPEIVAVCARNRQTQGWCREHFPSIKLITDDYREVLASPRVEAVYVAVPHHLHQEMYVAAIEAGKHLMGEKPFGIDLPANEAILACARRHPEVFVRCCSQMPFLPAVQKIGRIIDEGLIGTILEVETGFLHSSDLDPDKPINWKRVVETNGEYGVMGDLGMHACHVPFRAGWRPVNVRAVLGKVFRERPDGRGGRAPCLTWDNATLLCEARDPAGGESFPWTLRCFRIAPGEKNTWYVRILGTKTSLRFSTKNPKRLEILSYAGGEQIWGAIDVGMDTAFASITGGVFEAGFSDAVQQMWAAYLYELHHGRPPSRFAGCVTPEEAALSHRLFAAALESHRGGTVVAVGGG
ncbi:MAG: hypothetical protein AMXMBFR83_11960 [Phycisphaerae bacterium]